MGALKVVARAAALRILPRVVLDMILRPVRNLLSVKSHLTVAMRAADVP